ncbi:hypothetical protein [Shewanella sp. 10N.286.48.A6]|uniref:hypothetical protein n=1 Tax=Shewanella sp. 10N.286.48.A6 TaxID=1880833 RepID=UPI000C85E2C7|nr:hypothetical protein [Shewanella sp. 10N.286.48.A6]PMI01885.1 hypothetical protein BCU55_09405 [Shewanella sp. 10N.286.48.A6]
MSLGFLDKTFIKALKRALESSKMNPIPRSGPEGEAVDCYSIYVTDDSGSYLAESVEGKLLVCNKWNEKQKSHNLRAKLNLEKLESMSFELTHYHGLITHSYNSRLKFLIYELTGYYKLVSLWLICKYKFPKFLYKHKFRT